MVNHTLSTTFAGDTQLLSLRVLIGTVMVMTVAMFASKAFIDARILQPAAAAAAATEASSSGSKPPKKKKKSKGTFAEGLAVLKNSPKIRNLALLVMSYGVGHRWVGWLLNNPSAWHPVFEWLLRHDHVHLVIHILVAP